jgi:hypothetical protein
MMWLKSIIHLAVNNSGMTVDEKTTQKDLISDLTVMIQSSLKRSVAVRPLARFKDCGVILSFKEIGEDLCNCKFEIRLTKCTHINAIKIQGSFAKEIKPLFVFYVELMTFEERCHDCPLGRMIIGRSHVKSVKMIRSLTERQISVNHISGQCPECNDCTHKPLTESFYWMGAFKVHGGNTIPSVAGT